MSQSSPWHISSTSKFGLTSWSQASRPYFLGLSSSSISSRIDWLKLTDLRLRLNDDEMHRPCSVITPSQQTFRNFRALSPKLLKLSWKFRYFVVHVKWITSWIFTTAIHVVYAFSFWLSEFLHLFMLPYCVKLIRLLKLFLWLAPFKKESTKELMIFHVPYSGQ